MKDIVVLIPAYCPDDKLLKLVRDLRAAGLVRIVVVDDGNGAASHAVFENCRALGAHIVRHAANLGKGRALKTGINEALLLYPDMAGLVTADADGQHAPADVLRLAQEQLRRPDELIIGARAFSGRVPLKSRLGNGITRFVYFLCTGMPVDDTQTGLRGLPVPRLAELLRLPGERYDYEMKLLMDLPRLALRPVSLPIATIYIDDNKSSHFRAVRDGARIYRTIFTSRLSFCLAWLCALAAYALLLATLPGLAPPAADAIARAVQWALVPGKKPALLRYLPMMALAAALVYGLGLLGVSPLWAHLIADAVLLVFSRLLDRRHWSRERPAAR